MDQVCFDSFPLTVNSPVAGPSTPAPRPSETAPEDVEITPKAAETAGATTNPPISFAEFLARNPEAWKSAGAPPLNFPKRTSESLDGGHDILKMEEARYETLGIIHHVREGKRNRQVSRAPARGGNLSWWPSEGE